MRALTLRWSARIALLHKQVNEFIDRSLSDVDSGMNHGLDAAVRGLRGVGHLLASTLGLYRLDRWLTARNRAANLELADKLDEAGLTVQASMLREASQETT